MIKAIEDGAYNASLKARLATPDAEKTAAASALAQVKPPPVVRVHPNLPDLYRTKVAKLAEALNKPETATEAAEIIRTLIERISSLQSVMV